ncbi:AfsR/SARP family transcriptional regulator [Amycolatopsis cihanbeyliensis]|uniref:AfsR/SARP family transcriptional regulator n=1 Tax=Amycolatopsis cihanbeyliensis TaxID=1128664 RepID=UPI001B87ED4A|nr:BTAD domain-containing putative transcriptional regulator [Amycolatopsis cihanbeyliensis]
MDVTDRTAGGDLVVRLLGSVGLDAHDGAAGGTATAGPAKQCCVLAALALSPGKPVPLESLIDRVWGEEPPTTARDTLYGYIARLRRLLRELGREGVVTLGKHGGGYVLEVPPEQVDVCLMREVAGQGRAALAAGEPGRAARLLRDAAALWRGPALAGVGGDWAERVRDGLERERLGLLGDLFEAELAAGRHAEVVAELANVVAEHPLAEPLVRWLMLALYRVGRSSEALDCFTALARRLRAELGTEPGATLGELHQRILREDPELLAEGAERPAHLGFPMPRQLPADVGGFVGRADELKQLDALPLAGEPGSTPIVVIAGTGGIGKTALAVHWAQRNLDRFPDGQLHVNLRGFDPSCEPSSPSAVLRGFLDALGADAAAIPADLDGRAALYRSMVAGKRLLVVLDNARDATQVEPLLPGSETCTALVTSRRRLPGLQLRGGRLVNLDVLSAGEARELLAGQLGVERVLSEPAVAADLVRWCAGLPLAVSIVVARAAAHPDFPLAVLAEELRGASARLDAFDAGELTANLRAVFSWSCRALGTAAAGMFRLLGLVQGPDISLRAAASLAALPPERARVLLRELEAAHLVQQHVPGRYRMHDLLRLYAAEQATESGAPKELRTAARRLVDFYLHTAHAADRLLYPQRPLIAPGPPAEGALPEVPASTAAAAAWFDTEHECLLAAQETAIAQGMDAQVWLLAWVLGSFHRRRGNPQESLESWLAGVAAADRLGEPFARGWAHREIGHTYARVGEQAQALEHLELALELFTEAGDLGAKAHAHQALAVVLEFAGDNQRALAESHHSLRLFQEVGDHVWAADMRGAIGWFEAKLGNFETARVHCEEGLALCRRHGHRRAEAQTLDSLGYIVRHLGEYDQAVRHYGEALALFRELRHTYEEARTLASLGDTHHAFGATGVAVEYWRRAVTLFREQRRTADVERVERKLADAGTRSG